MNETWLAHHGIPGMKWGVRRYQNKDGSLTEAGKKRYLNPDGSLKPNKVINARDYSVNQALTKAKRQTGKKYDLTDEQKKYMDESGNLTLEGGRKTLPLGQDITKYKEASKERSEWSAAWNKYFKDRSDESYKDFLKKQDVLFSKINEIDMENGRNWILNNIVSTQKMKKPGGAIVDGYKKQDLPKNAKVDGPQKIEPISIKSFAEKKRDFMKTYKPAKGSQNSLYDIDDDDLIEMEIDDPDFRKEYGVSDSDYERWKKTVRN